MSVFTFDTDQPRVSSPWLRPTDAKKALIDHDQISRNARFKHGVLSDYGVTKLEAEPQDGPTEYKLHLLLRARGPFNGMNTPVRISGSSQTRLASEYKAQKLPSSPVAPSSPSQQSRQARLEQLTTQLLWRLQQSCPYHAVSNTKELVIPKLPDDNVPVCAPVKVGKLLPGLEVSRGALYEIGVADDGTLVGLTKDEMDESLTTLRIMAASLGCIVEVLRTVIVGECEWVESDDTSRSKEDNSRDFARRGRLWVAEALVLPSLDSKDLAIEAGIPNSRQSPSLAKPLDPTQSPLTTNQLRVTLTGPTTSGKSTLLGTLSTGTLDNGHGRSRLGLLKHRHEVVSGVTSSVAQELIGYNDDKIYNYANRGIESWIDIHDYTKQGRLAFVLDSAGHPRYRRTILRGIVGWAPHWTLLCISASDAESEPPVVGTSSSPNPAASGTGFDLTTAHLQLCLSLELPLAVVITKLDLATRTSLPRRLGKILTAIKGAGRVPHLLQHKSRTVDLGSSDTISEVDQEPVLKVVDAIKHSGNLLTAVPIVLTSAVTGSGIGLVHALLQHLPLPPAPTSCDYFGLALNPEQPASLFHIEDRFSLPASYAPLVAKTEQESDMGTVVAGYMRFGSLSLGDRVLIGPFPANDDDSAEMTPDDRPCPGHYGLSVSHPSSAELARIAARNAVSASAIQGEWHNARVVSIRNLRLPVQSLEAGQVGSIGVVFDLVKANVSDTFLGTSPPLMPKIRKGMVLAIPTKQMDETAISLQAASGLTAIFNERAAGSLASGSLVNVYIASVRAAARVIHVSQVRLVDPKDGFGTNALDDVFDFMEQSSPDSAQLPGVGMSCEVEVQLELMTNREWIELGSQIVILEGGNRDRSGLIGYVGKVVEIVD